MCIFRAPLMLKLMNEDNVDDDGFDAEHDWL